MKNNRKFFSFSLFWEGVRQTKLFGILFAVLLGLQILLIIALPSLSLLTDENFQPELHSPEIVDGFYIAPLLIASFCVAAPVLTLSLFRFLNQRSSADFYHAIPYKRGCIYLSMMGSVFFWLLLYAAEAIVLGLGMCALFCQFFTPLVGAFLLYVLATTVAALAVAAGISIAMSITGTVFTNLVMSALVLFLPRLIIFCLVLAVTEALPILTAGQLRPLLDGGINLISGSVFSVFLQGFLGGGYMPSITEILVDPAAIGYTAILTLVYLAVGGILFAGRKSETAQRSAPSPKLQAAYRIGLTFAYFAVFVSVLFSQILYGHVEWEILLLIVLFGLLLYYLYYLYELFTTKSFKKLLRATPGLGIVALAVLVFFGVLFGATRLELGFTPEAEQIRSITVLSDTDKSDRYLEFSAYAELCSPEVELTDPALLRLVAGCLDEQTTLLREQGYDAYREAYVYSYYAETSSYSYTDSSLSGRYVGLDLRIRSEVGTKVRHILFTEEELREVTAAMERDQAYTDIWLTLPEAIGEAELNGSYIPWDQRTNEMAKEILSLAAEELKTADFNTWYQACQNYESSEFSLGYTVASGAAQGKHIYVSLIPEIFPQTLKRCYEFEAQVLQEKAEEIQALLDIYDEASAEEKQLWYLHCNLSIPNANGQEISSFSLDSAEAARYLLANLRTEPRTPGDDTLPTAYISVEGPDGKEIYSEDHVTVQVAGTGYSFFLREDITLKDLTAFASDEAE